jgi:hypothetical protein
MSVGTVIVAHQIMPRHLEPQQLSPAMAHYENGKQALNCDGWNHAHVDGSDRLSVITQKCLPGLRWRLPTSHHVFGDRGLGHIEPEH